MSSIGSAAAVGDAYGTVLVARSALQEGLSVPHFSYTLVCRDKDGAVKWEETVENLVTTEGKNDIIDKYFKGSGYTATWFLGLKGTGAPDAADTLSVHNGWAEVTSYVGNRAAITFGTTGVPTAGSNQASPVIFSINASTTVAGAFIVSVNTGTSGKLYSVADFSAPRSVVSGDTLTVTPTVSAS